MDNQTIEPTNPSVQTVPPVQPTPPVAPPPSKSFISGKLIILIVIFLIIFAGGGIYLALNSRSKPASTVSKALQTSAPTPTPDPTASWKTYENQEWGYKILYPPNYHVALENVFGVPSLSISAPERNPGDTYSYLSVLYLSKDYLLKNYEARGKKYENEIFNSVANVEDTTISNVKAKKFTKVDNDELYRAQIGAYAEYKENGYAFSADIVQPDELGTFEKIISTFKFTKNP